MSQSLKLAFFSLNINIRKLINNKENYVKYQLLLFISQIDRLIKRFLKTLSVCYLLQILL